MTPAVIFSACAVGSVLVALVCWFDERRIRRALPRLVVTTGVVRQLETILIDRRAGRIRSMTLVQVEFTVGEKTYCCRDLFLFAGNRHLGDVGKKYDFPPGQPVGVYYDPEDPRRSALIVDKPSHEFAVISMIMAGIFTVIALLTA